MKKLVLSILVTLVYVLSANSQIPILEQSVSSDYSEFEKIAKGQTWILSGISHSEEYSGVYIDILFTNKNQTTFKFPKNITISGSFGVYNPIGLFIQGEKYELGKLWNYNYGIKNSKVRCLLIFPRIPVGVSVINYREPGFIIWDNIPIEDNSSPTEQTNWTEESLMTYFNENKCLPIEGIYCFTSTTNKKWWGENKHTLAIKKEGLYYKIIYIRGSNPQVWKEGEIKASFIPTSKKGLYKSKYWYLDNKIEKEDFYMTFNDGFMSIYENTDDVTANFLKLYPADDENYSSECIYEQPEKRGSSLENKTISGSGVFISKNIVVTNYHLVKDAKEIAIILKDGNNIATYTGKILSQDIANDLVLLSVSGENFTGVGTIPYSLSLKTKDVGTSVYTMSCPLDDYMGTEVKIIDGIINSKTGYKNDIVTYQISASVQPGSSGAPLFDKRGQLIGITKAGMPGAQNVGYAIKSLYLYNLIESAPISIPISEGSTLDSLDLTEQIKMLSKYVVSIKVTM
ncbi:MAG: trypsin-like peptidase domain-containing protein [Bacteroidales bacterium]|nr:trypsin-like peptidase domain-containing protein [Bacteroidales bacterium]